MEGRSESLPGGNVVSLFEVNKGCMQLGLGKERAGLERPKKHAPYQDPDPHN